MNPHAPLADQYWRSEFRLCRKQNKDAKFIDQVHLSRHLHESIRGQQSRFQPWFTTSLYFLLLMSLGLAIVSTYFLGSFALVVCTQLVNSFIRFRQRNLAFRKYVAAHSSDLLANCGPLSTTIASG